MLRPEPDLPDHVLTSLPARPPAPPSRAAPAPAPREAPGGPLDIPRDLPGSLDSADVSDVAADVVAGLDPLAAVRDNLLARIPALHGLLPADTLPTTLALTPTFGDGLSDDLALLGAEYLLPGAGALGHNRVRLVESDPEFAATFLIGANHGLALELLWRGYPVDLTGTFFKRFWRYADEGKLDIEPLAGWTRTASIADNLPEGTEAMTVFVIRGDVVRRYPTAHYFLQKAQLVDGEIKPVPGDVAPAVVRGALDRDTLFVGFEEASEDVIGDRAGGDPGWLLAIEEQPAAPRFGLDDPPEPPDPTGYGAKPASWNDLSWDNVATDAKQLAGLTHAPVDVDWLTGATNEIEGSTWGENAAHIARACWQQPFRIYFPGDQLD